MTTLDDLRNEFLQCKTFGHAWEEVPLDKKTIFFETESCRCTRCGTKRYFGLDAFFNVIQREYIYPDGYKLAEKVTRREFRKEMAQRRRSKLRTRRKNA